jgi:hypothetical protein
MKNIKLIVALVTALAFAVSGLAFAATSAPVKADGDKVIKLAQEKKPEAKEPEKKEEKKDEKKGEEKAKEPEKKPAKLPEKGC